MSDTEILDTMPNLWTDKKLLNVLVLRYLYKVVETDFSISHDWICLFQLAEQLYLTQMEEREKEKDKMEATSQIKDALEQQMESHREHHQKQLAELRQEITEKRTRIDELSE